jgi:nucleoside-diphosphate-sugar epimerase
MTVGEMLRLLLAQSPQGPAIRVEVDPALLRPSDVTLQIPCVDKFVAATGWQPLIPLERTLGDLLDYWRARCRQER